MFALDGHRGRKLPKSCSNTSLAIRAGTKRGLCVAAAPLALGRGVGGGSEERGVQEKGGWMELAQGGLDVNQQPRCSPRSLTVCKWFLEGLCKGLRCRSLEELGCSEQHLLAGCFASPCLHAQASKYPGFVSGSALACGAWVQVGT